MEGNIEQAIQAAAPPASIKSGKKISKEDYQLLQQYQLQQMQVQQMITRFELEKLKTFDKLKELEADKNRFEVEIHKKYGLEMSMNIQIDEELNILLPPDTKQGQDVIKVPEGKAGEADDAQEVVEEAPAPEKPETD